MYYYDSQSRAGSRAHVSSSVPSLITEMGFCYLGATGHGSLDLGKGVLTREANLVVLGKGKPKYATTYNLNEVKCAQAGDLVIWCGAIGR